MNLTDTFINTLYTLKSQPLPAQVKEETRKCLLDQIGVMIAGAALLKEQLGKYLDMFSGDDATAIGLGRKASLQNAAVVNGISGHALDYDDGHRFSTVHLGSAVIPAVLAVAEKENLAMDDVIRGIAIGYEAAIRMGNCIQPAHRARGFHASGTVGTIGAAMGVAALLDFDREQMKSALAAACTSAGGILEMQENVSTLKPFNIGRATHDGITAALIVRAGFRGPQDVLEGKFGFLRAVCETYKPEVLSLETDSRYNICGSYHKPYASCRHTHGAAYAALKAVGDNNLNWRDIDRITVDMYAQGVNGHDHTEIPSAVAGKMSTPFCIALALITGNIGLSSFTEEALQNPDIAALTKKVTVRADEEMTSWVPKKRAARITVTMTNGEAFTAQVDFPLGEPELPMSIGDFRAKVTELGMYAGRTEQDIQQIIDKVLTFDGNAADLVKMLA
ncbi:MAG: MmgE/PrpD family protein [Oscillospiraceae bacterium]|nr:MmgE/PrpD family protein [Oscillospiraceae bacterium]